LYGHMRLALHVSSQGPLRPGRSALRFSHPRLRQTQGCSALPLLASRWTRTRVPFRKKGPASLTERLEVRLAPGEKDRLRRIAGAGGLTASDLVRLRALGRPVISRTDATTIRELRRLGGLLKKVHVDSGGAYSTATANALVSLTLAVNRLTNGQ
jgi:hypothetical protein